MKFAYTGFFLTNVLGWSFMTNPSFAETEWLCHDENQGPTGPEVSFQMMSNNEISNIYYSEAGDDGVYTLKCEKSSLREHSCTYENKGRKLTAKVRHVGRALMKSVDLMDSFTTQKTLLVCKPNERIENKTIVERFDGERVVTSNANSPDIIKIKLKLGQARVSGSTGGLWNEGSIQIDFKPSVQLGEGTLPLNSVSAPVEGGGISRGKNLDRYFGERQRTLNFSVATDHILRWNLNSRTCWSVQRQRSCISGDPSFTETFDGKTLNIYCDKIEKKFSDLAFDQCEEGTEEE